MLHLLGFLCLLTATATPHGWAPQDPVAYLDPTGSTDSTEVLGRMREAQARFERHRRRNLDRVWSGWGGSCDEVVGRMCMRYGEDDWEPGPEPPQIAGARNRLLEDLARAGERLPGDVWIRGQRIRYLAEADRWEDALRVASGCRGGEPGWCEALAGYALHGAGRTVASERAFARALVRMAPAEAGEWRDPSILLDDRGDVLRDADAPLPPHRMIERAWSLADPLYLVSGNDRLTAHYSRFVVAGLRADARNTYGMSWGHDLAELLVRFGWEVGWELTHPAAGESRRQEVVGHHHPSALTYMPSSRVLRAPETSDPEDWNLDPDRPRSAYAPLYAPRVTTADAQVARFWRRDSVVVVGAYRMRPPESGRPDGSGLPPVPDPVPDDLPTRAGMFLLPAGGGGMLAVTEPSHPTGSFSLRVAAGSYVLSIESLSDSLAFASRARTGLRADTLPADLTALSDLLLVDITGGPPATLVDAVRQAWPGTSFQMGQPLGVAWELTGLPPGPSSEWVEYGITVEKRDRSIVEKAGSWLGLFGDGPELELAWGEETDGGMRTHFRATALDLPDLEPGRYRLVLTATLRGRETMAVERLVTVLQ